MKPVRYHLILNPRSKGGTAVRRFSKIFSLMGKAGLDYDFVLAETYESIMEAAYTATENGYDVIVAVGGDGTINAVINGMIKADGITKGKKLGVIYTGTSPDFCKSYGVPTDIEEAVGALTRHRIRKIRPGSIDLITATEPGHNETRYFSCCASIGIGAMVAEKANRNRKLAGDQLGTLGAILSSLVRYKTCDMVLKMGKDEHFIPRVTNVFIGRTKYIASGLKVNFEIPDEKEGFYVIAVNKLKVFQLPALLKQLYSGNIRESGVLKVFFGNNISVYTQNNHTRVEFDGDAAGYIPCNVNSLPDSLSLIIS